MSYAQCCARLCGAGQPCLGAKSGPCTNFVAAYYVDAVCKGSAKTFNELVDTFEELLPRLQDAVIKGEMGALPEFLKLLQQYFALRAQGAAIPPELEAHFFRLIRQFGIDVDVAWQNTKVQTYEVGKMIVVNYLIYFVVLKLLERWFGCYLSTPVMVMTAAVLACFAPTRLVEITSVYAFQLVVVGSVLLLSTSWYQECH